MEEDAYITSVIDSHRVAFTLNQEVYRADFTIIGDGSTSNTTSCASYNCVKKKKKKEKNTLECTTPACTNKGPQTHCILAQLLSLNISSHVVIDRSKAQTQYRLVGREQPAVARGSCSLEERQGSGLPENKSESSFWSEGGWEERMTPERRRVQWL